MGGSLCNVAIFGNFQNGLIFQILAGFSSRFLHGSPFMCLWKRFSHVLGNLHFLTQSDHFAWAIYGNFQNALDF